MSDECEYGESDERKLNESDKCVYDESDECDEHDESDESDESDEIQQNEVNVEKQVNLLFAYDHGPFLKNKKINDLELIEYNCKHYLQ